MSRKQSWEERYRKIRSQYPNFDSVSWSAVFSSDVDVFSKLLGDVLKSDGRGSIPGKRPQLSRMEGIDKLTKIAGEDYSDFDFLTTFRGMSSGLSIRKIAIKTDLGKSYIQLLLNGKGTPSLEAMEKIAVGFGKKPTYFLEYRIARVVVMIEDFLRDSPETATLWYSRLYGAKK